MLYIYEDLGTIVDWTPYLLTYLLTQSPWPWL